MSTEDKEGQENPTLHAEKDDENEDTEGHRFPVTKSADPDFGSQQPSVESAAKADEDDTEGHHMNPGR